MTNPTTRTVTLRVSATIIPDQDIGVVTGRLTQAAETFSDHGYDVYYGATTDTPAADEHPERDALVALADEWRQSHGVVGRAHADELTRLVATLNL